MQNLYDVILSALQRELLYMSIAYYLNFLFLIGDIQFCIISFAIISQHCDFHSLIFPTN
jgi:hypothetical protein